MNRPRRRPRPPLPLPEFAVAGYDATLPAYSQAGFASDERLRTMLEIVTKGKVGEFSPSRLADFSFLREALADLKTGKQRFLVRSAESLISTFREFQRTW